MHVSWQRVITTTATLLILCGVVFLIWRPLQSFIIRQQGIEQNTTLLQQSRVVAKEELVLENPTHMTLPRLAIDLPVQKGSYNSESESWTLDRQSAFLMTYHDKQTPTPIIYGHNIPEVFQPLDGVARNELLVVTDSTGTRHVFAYTGDKKVSPIDTSVMEDDIPNAVLLMTCTGPRFEQRRILQFTFIGTEPAVAYGRE